MNIINTILIEDNQAECWALLEAAKEYPEIAVTAVTDSAIKAAELLTQHEFPSMIVDLDLPEGDGVNLICDLPSYCPHSRPLVLVTTCITSETVFRCLRAYGADHIMRKGDPSYNAAYVMQTLARMAPYRNPCPNLPATSWTQAFSPEEMRRQNVLDRIGRMLVSYGARPNLDGYDFIIEAVKAFMEASGPPPSLSKEVYPAIARRYGKSSASVEHSIRHTIEKMWSANPQRMRNDGIPWDPKTGKCTNGCLCRFLAAQFRADYRGYVTGEGR